MQELGRDPAPPREEGRDAGRKAVLGCREDAAGDGASSGPQFPHLSPTGAQPLILGFLQLSVSIPTSQDSDSGAVWGFRFSLGGCWAS